ncbi:hypothetical protein [Glaciibacter psychrotolerans]|uniref:Uncharacterized protein n=1 Tax=Glaciibacter psychrotolerans TaxID=670054 RepID=A0A7Z0EGU0_9MICO|nr:hypothetical protein [Leifsonia psychrotolerans]NYJ21401.1 hypothetical protein [Leifsonia psychrotolerans]
MECPSLGPMVFRQEGSHGTRAFLQNYCADPANSGHTHAKTRIIFIFFALITRDDHYYCVERPGAALFGVSKNFVGAPGQAFTAADAVVAAHEEHQGPRVELGNDFEP